MKRSMIAMLGVVAVMLMAGAASADVYLNATDYGTNLTGAINAATTPGDVIEIRDNGTYLVDNAGATFNTANVTLRSAAGYKATIESTGGSTNGLFYVNAGNDTFSNLIIKNSPSTVYGTYTFWFGGTKDAAYNYPSLGMTVSNVEIDDMRGVICAGSGYVTNLTFTNNVINNVDYGLGKSGMGYGAGTTTITGNTFNNNGTMADKAPATREPVIWIESNLGSLLIDNNTFQYNHDSVGQYAIYSAVDLSAHPIDLGTNDFGTGVGGSGAPCQLDPLVGGGYAVGLLNAASVTPEPATMSLLAMGGLALIRRRRK